jgi:hypothetical protein
MVWGALVNLSVIIAIIAILFLFKSRRQRARTVERPAPAVDGRSNRILLEDAPAVRALRASLPYSRPKAVVEISDTSLTEGERRRWEERLSRYYPACGCTFGKALLSLTVLVGAMGVLRQWWITAVFPGATVAFVVTATPLAALLGKIIGLFLGHIRMSRALRSLELRLEPS